MLKAVLEVAAIFALLTLGVSTIVLTRDTHRIALDADATLRDIDTITKAQSLNLSQDEIHLGLVLDQVNQAAAEQRAYWQKTSADSDKTVKALRLTVDRAALLLDHTDKQLNGSLLPDVDRQFNLTAESAQASFSSLTHAGDALTFQIDDLQPIFANLATASENVASGTGHADKILLDGEKTANYYEKKLTTPATFAQKLAGAVLSYGSEARILFVGH